MKTTTRLVDNMEATPLTQATAKATTKEYAQTHSPTNGTNMRNQRHKRMLCCMQQRLQVDFRLGFSVPRPRQMLAHVFVPVP